MKHLNFLTKSSSQSCGHNVVTLASTVGSQEEFYVSGGNSRGAFTPADVCQTSSVRLNRFTAHRRSTMLKLLSVLVLILTIGVGNAWGTSSVTTGTYTKQSSVAVTENGSYIFLFGTTSSAYAMTNANNSGSSNYVARSSEYKSLPNSITITNDNKNLVWVVSNYNNGSFKLDGPNGYCYCQGTGKLAVNSSSSSTWHIGTTSNVIYLIDANNCYVKNTGTSGFRAYNTTSNRTQLVAIYKLEASYTITAVPNNELWGTVSGTSTITAIPEDGYRVKAGNEGYTVTSGSATVTNNGDNTFSVSTTENCTIQINFEEIPTHTVTWSANGNTSNTSVVAEGSAIPFPESASGCTGKTFMGWTSKPIVGETDDEPTYVTSANMGTSNITYYAVFADADEGGGTIDVTDLITASSLAATGTTYTAFSGVNGTNSDAEYAGNSSKNGSDIQLRGSNSSGIVSTTSGGKVKSVVIEWSSNATASRTIDIYGSHSAYSTAADLYNTSTDGDKVGSIVYTSSTNYATTYTFTSDYEYVGIRMNSNATRMVSISITWKASGGTTYSNYTTSCCTPLGSINGSFS